VGIRDTWGLVSLLGSSTGKHVTPERRNPSNGDVKEDTGTRSPSNRRKEEKNWE
jgi:hypothetical protein